MLSLLFSRYPSTFAASFVRVESVSRLVALFKLRSVFMASFVWVLLFPFWNKIRRTGTEAAMMVMAPSAHPQIVTETLSTGQG